jgi:hypothetical protein
MKTKFIIFILAVLATTPVMGFSATAQDRTPQSCFDGGEYLGSYEYKKLIRKLTASLGSDSLSRESRANTLFNRALAHFLLYEEKLDEEFDEAFNHLETALDDIDKSIKLDPTGIPKAYCLRGGMSLDYSFGGYGYEDLDKGIAMGAPKEFCAC